MMWWNLSELQSLVVLDLVWDPLNLSADLAAVWTHISPLVVVITTALYFIIVSVTAWHHHGNLSVKTEEWAFMFSTQWGGGQCVHERSVCKWAKCKRHKSASHTKLRLTKHMSKHWAQKAKCILDAWLVCFHCYIREQAFGCSTQKAYYCAHNKAEDKLLWTWQLNDSSTVRLEENCLVKVFTEITSNDSCKKKTKQRKQWTMVLTNPVELYDKCAYYLSYVYLWGMCAFMELMWNDIWWRINTLLLLKYFIDPLWQTVIWTTKHRWLSYHGA